MNVTVRGVVRRNAEGDIDLQHLIVPFTQKGSDRLLPCRPLSASGGLSFG